MLIYPDLYVKTTYLNLSQHLSTFIVARVGNCQPQAGRQGQTKHDRMRQSDLSVLLKTFTGSRVFSLVHLSKICFNVEQMAAIFRPEKSS